MRGEVRVYQRKIVAKKRRQAFYYPFYSLCAATIFVCALSFVSHIESLSIQRVEIAGNERMLSSDIESIVWKSLSGNYQGLFSRRNALLYPRDEIAVSIALAPLVKSVEVSREGLGTVSVRIVEREEAALWCEDDSEEALCYSVDEEGFVFASVFDRASSTESFVYRGLIEEEPIGKKLLSGPEFKKMQFFIRELSGLSVEPREARLGGSGSLSVLLGAGGRIVVNQRDDLSAVLGNIAAVISDRKVAPDLRAFLDTLDYIKFDAGNKVVYKVKGSTAPLE
ncbi:MAG: FtsQ-type POTRA domain-containing protein [Candidatus Taylorbacteria bacterium]|nr:FtsQ-type POTRA domain-containing protein [Candidatus Taylorbacteria bacterium]